MRIRAVLTQLFAAALVTFSGLAQALPRQIQIQKLEVLPTLPAPPGSLETLKAAVRLEATSSGYPEGQEAWLMLQIRQDGQPVCGTKPDAAITLRVTPRMRLDGTILASAFNDCRELEPGVYRLCAQFYGSEGVLLSAEVCTDFRVGSTPAAAVYAPPQNLYPEPGYIEAEERLRDGLRFSWKPVTPTYDGELRYRLRVWALPEGRDAGTVVSEAQPVLVRDAGAATEISVRDGFPRNAKPGTTSYYVWTVQALNAAGQAIGTSPPTTFAITTYAIQLDKIAVSCTATPGVYSFSFSLTNPNIGTAKLSAFQVTGSMPAGATITSFAPPLNTSIGAGVQLTVTGTLTAAPGLSNICIGAQITDLGNSFWQASKDTCIPVKPCKCEACDPKKVSIQTPTSTLALAANNTVTLSQPISVSTTPLKLVKSVDAELVYYAYAPDDEDCMPCNRDSRTFGNFLAGTLGPLPGAGTGTHALGWNFSPPKNASTATSMSATISLPPMVRCCDATLRFCIRYVITFADCTVCNKLVCYEKRLDGCSGGSASSNNN